MHELAKEEWLYLDFVDNEVKRQFVERVLFYYEYEFIGVENLANLLSHEFAHYYCEDAVDDLKPMEMTVVLDEVFEDVYSDVLKVCKHHHLVILEFMDPSDPEHSDQQNSLTFIQAPWVPVW